MMIRLSTSSLRSVRQDHSVIHEQLNSRVASMQVAALLSGQAKFSLNDLYAVCVDWAEQARAESNPGLPAWPGLKAVVRLISADKSLAKEAIFTVLE